MTLPNFGRTKRAPRVNVPSRERALVDIGGREFTAELCKLSVTGGSLRIKAIPEGRLAGITLETTNGRIESAIQFLKPDEGGRQGFRFVQLDAMTRYRLQDALGEMRRQGLGEGSSSVIEFCTNTARRVMKKVKTHMDSA